MTPNEITTLIASNFGKELDTRFKKQLYERVKVWRSTLIKQSLDKVRTDIRFFTQTIYLSMEKINAMECIGDVSCFVARSTIEVPGAIRVTDVGIYQYIGGIDGFSPFGFADAGTLRYLRSGKYSKKFNYYQFNNHKVVCTELPDLPKIRIDGVFNDPEDAMPYESCAATDETCDWWNKDIPMSGDIEQRVIQCILTVDYNRPGADSNHQIEVNDSSKP